MEMKILATFVGTNREFQAWLRAGMPANGKTSQAHSIDRVRREEEGGIV
jgi:hypothetical protein